jgi:hypothetical protein
MMSLEFIPLHKTFAAEVRGVDFSRPVPKDVADELVRAADKYGVLVFRKTGLTDEAHIQFSKHFGDLDDISGYIPPGVSMSRRTRFLELFDASNLDPATEKPVKEHEKRFQYNKVSHSSIMLISGERFMACRFLIQRSTRFIFNLVGSRPSSQRRWRYPFRRYPHRLQKPPTIQKGFPRRSQTRALPLALPQSRSIRLHGRRTRSKEQTRRSPRSHPNQSRRH